MATSLLVQVRFWKAIELAIGNFHRYEIWIFGALRLLAVILLADFIRKSRAAVKRN